MPDIPDIFIGAWVRRGLSLDGGPFHEDSIVWWLQGPRAHADLRVPISGGPSTCFAGVTSWDGAALTWARSVDLEHYAGVDTGMVSWDGPDLLEAGQFPNDDGTTTHYVERWVRLPDSSGPVWAEARGENYAVRVGAYALTISDERTSGGPFRGTAWERARRLDRAPHPAGHGPGDVTLRCLGRPVSPDTIAILFSAVTAIAFGTSDFLGGMASARMDPRLVACAVNIITAVLVAPVAWATGSTATRTGLVAAVGAGTIEAIGAVALFRGLSEGRMGVVAPIAGIVNAVVPMVVGTFRGETHGPVAWVGLMLAGPAIVLMTSAPARSDRPSGWLYGIIAGIGFGTGFAVLGSMPARASLATLAMTQIMAATLLGITCVAARLRVPRSTSGHVGWMICAGLIGGTGLASFQVAARHGHLGESAVISSFYPAMTVVLAAVVLRERLFRLQILGFLICAASLGLVVLG